MNIKQSTLAICSFALLVFSAVVNAQDADKDKLIAIEQEYAAPAPAPGTPTPMQKYMYDGPVMALNAQGRLNITSKTQLMAGRGTANAANPATKRETTRQNFHVELYDDTALITYKQTVVESGHEDPALNKTTNTTCLDTFVKRNGNWYGISNTCVNSPQP
jgi:hypothetical protein